MNWIGIISEKMIYKQESWKRSGEFELMVATKLHFQNNPGLFSFYSDH